MIDDCKLVNAIGETGDKIGEAADFLCGVIANICESEEDKAESRIGTFVRFGPDGGKVPWLILVGPAPVMCEHATESARETGIKLIKMYRKFEETEADDE